jgi:hypothetical protein
LLETELSLLTPRHVVSFVTKQQTSKIFFEFFEWLDGSEEKYNMDFNVSDPENLNSEGIVVLFQTIPDVAFVEYLKKFAQRSILIVSAEPELSGYTIQLLLKKEFTFNASVLPSMILKDISSREYLLEMLRLLYLKTRYFSELKVQRHQALYNVIKKYYK